jgi:hypothetical protein
MRYNQGGSVNLRYHIRNSESLARTSYSEQDLMSYIIENAFAKGFNGLWLVTFWFEIRYKLELAV